MLLISDATVYIAANWLWFQHERKPQGANKYYLHKPQINTKAGQQKIALAEAGNNISHNRLGKMQFPSLLNVKYNEEFTFS